jgi:hypothetical protein
MKIGLILAAVAEAATGLALLILPSRVGKSLLGVELTGVTVPVARVAGIALIGLNVPRSKVRNLAHSSRNS